MINLLFLLLLILLTYLIGLKFLIFIKLQFNNLSERILLSIVFGLGTISLVMFFLGIFGLYYKSIIVSVFVISLIILVLLYGKKEYVYLKDRIILSSLRKNYVLWLIFGIFCIYVFYNLLRCMTPVLNGDSLHAYLHVPNIYTQSHRIFSIDWAHYDNLPLNIYMLNALGILLHSDILSQLISGWFLGLLSALAIYVLTRNFVNRKIAFLSAIIFYTMPTLSWLIFSTKVDLGYTLFELSFWILFVKWIKSHNRRYLFISAIFLGFAIGSKYHSLIALSFAIIAGLVILIMNKRKFKYVIFTVFIFGLVALAIGSPSYIKNYIYTNDPVYPFITNPSTGSHEELNQYHGILDYIRFQYNMIFNKDYIIKSRPMMDKPIGFLPILFLPFLFFIRKIRKRDKIAIIILVAYYLFLSFIIYKSVYPFPRHFLPAIGLLVVINSVGIKKSLTIINKNVVHIVLLFSIFSIVFLSNIGYGSSRFSQIKFKMNYILGKIDKVKYLKQTIFNSPFHMNYDMIEYVKTMPEEVRIMTLDYGSSYYVPRPFFKKGYMYRNRNIDSLLVDLQNDKITHIYFNKPTMDKYVERWQHGKYSVILEGLKNNKLILEKKADNQYLYKINYEDQETDYKIGE